MPHLTLEALARLVDEAPTTEERSHLDGCARCRQELQELQEQTDSLGSMPDMTPPPDLWPELQARLRSEGLVRRPRRLTGLTRIAAALTLFLAGGAAGFAVRGPLDAAPPPVASADPATEAADGTPTAPAAVASGPLASSDVAADVERTQDAFAAALDRYMMATSTEAPDPAARLAALDHIVMTTAEALNESPADPVINSYHLTAVAQRNELLRRIAASGEPVF